jgi:hypothetical protein
MSLLDELGYAVESSVTPHVDWSDVSPGLSFVDAPTQPYHPDPREPWRAGDARLLEVPVTIRRSLLARVPMLGRLVEHRWLRPTRSSGEALVAIARETIEAERGAHPGQAVVLNAMFHNVEVVAGTSPYASTDDEAWGIVERVGALLEYCRGEGIACVGLGDVPDVLAPGG